MTPPEFVAFSKIPRLSRNCVITEKIDGSNAQILIDENGGIMAGSRTRWITPGKQTDNYGFAAWVEGHKEELLTLGPGRHFGEWWGQGINRNYGLTEKRFSLFRPKGPLPACVGAVPILYQGPFETHAIDNVLDALKFGGSVAAPGFMAPEGIVVVHLASLTRFKKTIEDDESPKGAL